MDFMLKKVLKFLHLEDKDSCKCPRTNPEFCDSIEPLLKFSNKYKDFDLEKEVTKSYEETHSKIEENSKQIEKDLDRTFPGIAFFQTKECHSKMFNVLKAFSNFNKDISYVQGMNFIVGFFIFHASEYIAFWLFVILIEDYELKHVFADGLPGLISHSDNLKILLKEMLPDIHERFMVLEVEIEIVIAEWVFSLFSAVIPLKLQMDFYHGFFQEGWRFFYKLCMAIVIHVQGRLYTLDEPGDIYICLKLGKNDNNQDEDDYLDLWKSLLNNSNNIKIESIL